MSTSHREGQPLEERKDNVKREEFTTEDCPQELDATNADGAAKQELTDEMLEDDLKYTQKWLWNLTGLLREGEGLQHVSLDGLDYLCIAPSEAVIYSKGRGGGYRGYVCLLLNDKALYLWHVVESMDACVFERVLPRSGKSGVIRAVSHHELSMASSLFNLDVKMPVPSYASLVKFAECDEPDRRRFRCDYEFTEKRVPRSVFDHTVQSLRELYKCTQAEENTIRLFDHRMEGPIDAREAKSTPVFDHSETRSWPLSGFAELDFFADRDVIRKKIVERNVGEPTKRKLNAPQEEPPLKRRLQTLFTHQLVHHKDNEEI